MPETDVVPWSDLTDREREKFAGRLNREFDTDLSPEEAGEYYGNPEKVREELGDWDTQGIECPECFGELTQQDVPFMKITGLCPHCGAVLRS